MKNYILHCINHKATKFLFWGSFAIVNISFVIVLFLIIFDPAFVPVYQSISRRYVITAFRCLQFTGFFFNIIAFSFFMRRAIKKTPFSLFLRVVFLCNILILTDATIAVLEKLFDPYFYSSLHETFHTIL